MEECKPSPLSLHPIRRVVDSTRLNDSISQSESLPGNVECSSSASSCAYVKAEPLIDSTGYTGEEPKARLNRSDDTEEGTEWKIVFGMTKEEKDRISNMKEEEEEEDEVEVEDGLRQSMKMGSDDGVKYGEGLEREQEKVRGKWKRNGVTDQTDRCERNGGKSEYGQWEGAELPTLAPACLPKQPRGPSLLPSLSLGQAVEVSSQVFACSQCPFSHTEELHLHQHFEKVHSEDLIGTLRPGGSGGEELSTNRTHQRSEPSKTLCTSTQSHTGTKGAHICSQCGNSFKYKSQLTRHQLAHTGEYPYQCAQCGKKFKTKSGLTVHHHVHSEERPYHCSQCGKNFKSKSVLTKHQRTHTGERPHHCSQCGKSFGQLACLKVHPRIHTGERPYLCTQCGKHFILSSHLIRHQRVHTGSLPYHCSQCGKSFGQLDGLKIHQRTHLSERTYHCTLCGKGFIQSTHLRIHQQTHTGECPYHCTQCGRKFGHLSGLQVHQLSHTEERPYPCSQCGKSFKSKSNLRKHQRTHTTAPRFENGFREFKNLKKLQ